MNVDDSDFAPGETNELFFLSKIDFGDIRSIEFVIYNLLLNKILATYFLISIYIVTNFPSEYSVTFYNIVEV